MRLCGWSRKRLGLTLGKFRLSPLLLRSCWGWIWLNLMCRVRNRSSRVTIRWVRTRCLTSRFVITRARRWNLIWWYRRLDRCRRRLIRRCSVLWCPNSVGLNLKCSVCRSKFRRKCVFGLLRLPVLEVVVVVVRVTVVRMNSPTLLNVLVAWVGWRLRRFRRLVNFCVWRLRVCRLRLCR